jgi:hypothetical protein
MRRIALPVIIALVLVSAACSDDPEEDVVGASTTATAETTPLASQTPAPEGTVWRWANITVTIPNGSGILVGPDFAGQRTDGIMPLRLSVPNPEDSHNSSFVLLSANDGAVVERNVLAKDEALIEDALATITIGPLDAETAGWPYQKQLTADLPRLSEASVSYVSPSPDSGLYVGFGIGDPGGPFIDIRNERSAAFVMLRDGSLEFDTAQVTEADMPAFQRWLDEVRQCEVEVDC